MLKSLASGHAFCDVPARVLQQLVETAVVAEARKGTAIYEAAQRWDHLGFLVEGALAMFVPGEENRDRLYEHVYPGHFFGISSMFDGEPEMARTVVVSKKATYTLLERAHAVELCKEHGTLAVAFAAALARRVRHTTSLLAAQINLTAQQRIARYLLGFAEGSGLARARDPLPLMTQSQIGAAAGTVKEVVGRAVAMFESQGALQREHGRIHWLHRERLMELANVLAEE
jgi:CRP/FNR family transcriptional regulator